MLLKWLRLCSARYMYLPPVALLNCSFVVPGSCTNATSLISSMSGALLMLRTVAEMSVGASAAVEVRPAYRSPDMASTSPYERPRTMARFWSGVAPRQNSRHSGGQAAGASGSDSSACPWVGRSRR